MTDCYLNDLGVVCALGAGRAAVQTGLLDGDTGGMRQTEGLLVDAPCTVGAVATALPPVPPSQALYDCRNNRLALAALDEIATAIEGCKARYGRDRVGVVLGTSTSGVAAGEAAVRHAREHGDAPAHYHYCQQELGGLGDFVAGHLDVDGPTYTISTACSSSANALGSARRLLALGLCDAVVTGGVDSLCRMTVRGFDALGAVSRERCNPFSRNRCGINIGEAAALFVMSREPAPIALLGFGASSDAHHISAPAPGGRGARAAMREALTDAGLTDTDIDYINLHGTATPQNDAMESAAVHALFGNRVATSSTKPLTGHTLGAAGALEAAFCWLALSAGDRRVPPHVWDGVVDGDLAPIRLSAPGERAGRLTTCLSNSFAFGGNNVTLVLGLRS